METSTSPVPSLTMARSLPQGVEELSVMSAFELFQSQMDHGSTEAKVDAMKRLSVVAFAVGNETTINYFIPYLQTVALKQPPHEDEILLLLAEQIQKIVPNLLSESQQVLSLLPILERLATTEETVVRDQAVKAMDHISPYIKESSPLVNMAKRLVSADWFTAKVSVAGMSPVLYQVTQDDEFRFLYRDLCQDETPMVRRAAAIHLGRFLAQLTPNGVQEFQPILEQLCRDHQDSVRLLAIASLGDLGPKLDPSWTSMVLLPIVKSGSTDLSWRVRNNIAKSFSKVAESLNLNDNYVPQKNLIMSCFISLLQDQESEVRASAVRHLAPMIHWGGETLFVSHLQTLLPALADDVAVEVRSKCALALMDATEGGTLQDETIVRSFTPLLENFLHDEYSEVQLHVLSHLSRIAHLLNQMSGVVSSILNMSKVANWRVREGVGKLLPHLAEARGIDFFSSVLMEPAWIPLLLDPVANVRLACARSLQQLVRVAGDEWILSNLLPQHIQIYDQSATMYLVRMTILKAHAEMACQSKSGPLFIQVVEQLLRGAKDSVPNVRMVAAQGLYEAIKVGDEAVVNGKVRPIVEQLIQTETDPDSLQALEMCSNV